jgi:hypothetical protein
MPSGEGEPKAGVCGFFCPTPKGKIQNHFYKYLWRNFYEKPVVDDFFTHFVNVHF